MKIKKESFDSSVAPCDIEFVKWEDKYVTGIKLIDSQHRELVILANQLYQACCGGNEEVGTVFKDSMSRMVEYVRFHFGAEQSLLERINFPYHREHKAKHDALVKKILAAAMDYNEGKKFVPNQFVRTLKDWVFGHIAVEDKIYAAYAREQTKKGLLTGL